MIAVGIRGWRVRLKVLVSRRMPEGHLIGTGDVPK